MRIYSLMALMAILVGLSTGCRDEVAATTEPATTEVAATTAQPEKAAVTYDFTWEQVKDWSQDQRDSVAATGKTIEPAPAPKLSDEAYKARMRASELARYRELDSKESLTEDEKEEKANLRVLLDSSELAEATTGLKHTFTHSEEMVVNAKGEFIRYEREGHMWALGKDANDLQNARGLRERSHFSLLESNLENGRCDDPTPTAPAQQQAPATATPTTTTPAPSQQSSPEVGVWVPTDAPIMDMGSHTATPVRDAETTVAQQGPVVPDQYGPVQERPKARPLPGESPIVNEGMIQVAGATEKRQLMEYYSQLPSGNLPKWDMYVPGANKPLPVIGTVIKVGDVYSYLPDLGSKESDRWETIVVPSGVGAVHVMSSN